MATLSSLLVHDEVVSVDVIEDALQRQVLEGGDIDTALLEMGALQENVLNAYRAASAGLGPATREQLMVPNPEHLKLVSRELAQAHRVVPIGVSGKAVVLAVATAPEKPARDALRAGLGRDIHLRIAVEVRIEAALAEHFGLEIPGRMRRLAEQLRTRDAGPLPVIRVRNETRPRATEFSEDILRAFDSEPPPAPPAPEAEPRPSLARSGPVVSVAPVVRLGTAGHASVAATKPASVEAPPPPGVSFAPSTAPEPPVRRRASAPPTAPVFAAATPSELRPASAPTEPAFAAASAATSATTQTRSVAPKPMAVRIEHKPRPTAARRSMVPAGPLSAVAARERIEAAAERDAVLDVFFGFARQYFECTALFALRDEQALGVEARGLPDAVDIASVAIGVVKGGVLDEVERSRLPRVADLSRHEEDLPLIEALQRGATQPSAMVPVLIGQRAVFALYGDRGGAFFKVDDIADLVELLPAVSRAFERIIRTRKVFAREARGQSRPQPPAPQATPSMGPPLGTWGSAVLGAEPLPALPGLVSSRTEQPEDLSPVARDVPAPAWPPRSVPQEPAAPSEAYDNLQRVSSPFVRAVPSRLPPERALAPLGLSRDAPLPPHFSGKSAASPTRDADLDDERRPTQVLPQASVPTPAPTAPPARKSLSSRPPPGTGSYKVAPPAPETLRPMRTPRGSVEAETDARRKTDRPHRRRDEAPDITETQPVRRSRSVNPSPQASSASRTGASAGPRGRGIDPADRDDPRDTVRQRPAPVRKRADGPASSYRMQDVQSEVISVRPGPVEASDESLVSEEAAPEGPGLEAIALSPGSSERSIIVDFDADLEGLVAELMRCGPDDEVPVLARIARVGEPALPVLAARFPGPLWFDRRHAHQRLPRGRDVSAIARAFAAFGERADRYLIALLDSPAVETRFYATLLAVDSLRAGLLPALAARLFDADAKIRLLVLEALSAYQHLPAFDEVLDTLRARALDDKAALQTRMTAIDGLAELRDVDSLELLIALSVHHDRQLSVPAHRALVAITAQDFGNTERKWRAWLTKHGERYRAEWLIDGLMHSDEKVRAVAGRELQDLSQVYFGYVASAPKRERERAQRRYLEWWRSEGLPALHADSASDE